jgi:DNA-binding transcriptional LysR family regulator
MLELKGLSYFVAACEHQNLASAAQALDISPSTLSASLKALEAELGVGLFEKQGSGIGSKRPAHWLYRAALPVLLLEQFARRRAASPPDAFIDRIRVDVRLRFVFGRFQRAVNRAIATTAARDPLTFVDLRWQPEIGAPLGSDGAQSLGFRETGTILVDAVLRAAEPDAGEIALWRDRWVAVRRVAGTGDGVGDDRPINERRVMVPAFQPALVEQVAEYAAAQGIELETSGEPPSDWPRLLEESAGLTILLPESAVGTRLGVSNLEVTPLDPAVFSTLIATCDRSARTETFIEDLRGALSDGSHAPPFLPLLTARRIRYFNLACATGRVSGAARAAGVAQPALSQQLHRMEESLGISLFDRRVTGLAKTPAGTNLSAITGVLERWLRELTTGGSTSSLVDGGRLTLGVLPSVSHHGRLVGRVAEAVLELGRLYPAMSVVVREAPNGTLQKLVRSGRVGLAIVETAAPQLPRLPLDQGERLCLISDPARMLVSTENVRLREVAELPLALPTRLSGIRQLLDRATQRDGLKLSVRYEIDALPMLIAILAREVIATVLPASAVRPELQRGELVAHPITDPVISRKLVAIYSGDRALTQGEREFIRLLRDRLLALGDGAVLAGDVPAEPSAAVILMAR